eukprot:418487_1
MATSGSSLGAMLKPILRPPPCIINGMMKLEIINLDDILTDENMWSSFKAPIAFDFILTIHYRFQFKTHQEQTTATLYPHNTWQSRQFELNNMDEHNCVWLKVPLFLFSYQIEFNLNIKLMDCATLKSADDTSVTLIEHVPSMLIQSKHSVGDRVQYCVPNAGFVRSGVILELLDDRIKIETVPHYESLNRQALVVVIDEDKVYRDLIHSFCVVDLTDRQGAEIDLILATNASNKADIYKAVREGILHLAQYQYRVDCLFDGTSLFYEEQWKYDVALTYCQLRKGVEMNDLQDARDGYGYTCDICRMEIGWYQYMYHCQNEHQHDFCVSCIHGVIQQRNDIEKYMMELLHGQLDNDCIEQIVEFCVGRVLKFACTCQNQER